MSDVTRELRFALRTILRRPFTSAVAVLMLGLGLGFNTALFAVVEAVLLRPLPYDHADRLVMLWTRRDLASPGGVNSFPDYADWRQSKSFSALAVYNLSFGTLTGAGDPEEINGTVVSPEYFDVMRVPIARGRGLQAGDDLIPIEAVRPIVLSHGLWTRRFSADPSIVGTIITLAGRSRLVIGVVAPEYEHPDPFWGANAEYWSPFFVSDEMRSARGSRYLRVIGRLADGATVDAAQAEMDAIGRRLLESFPDPNRGSAVVAPLRGELVGDAGPVVLVFLAATGLLLLLVVANVASLLLARLSHRRAELAIRAALGAGRRRLVWVVVAESLVLGVAGGLAGLLFAQVGLRLIQAYGPGNVFSLDDAQINLRVVLYAIVVTLATALVCGIAPALRLARGNAWSGLVDLRRTSGLEMSRRRTLLVAGEIALAVPLLLGAVLLGRTLISLQHVDPGFDPSQALQFRVNLPTAQYEDSGRRVELFRSLVERLQAIPGVSAVGGSSSLPLGGLNNTGGDIVYERLDGTLTQTGVGTRAITGEYFRALGVPLREGRFLTGDRSDRQSVVINVSMADTLWPGASAIGRRIRTGTLTDTPPSDWLTVVGVAGDMRHELLSRPANPEVFQPYVANPWTTMSMVVRGVNTSHMTAPIRGALRAIDPSLPVVNLSNASVFLDSQLARPRFGAFSALILGGLAVVLAAVGTFGVLWLLVAQRTREIGIRMALGATPRSVARLVVAQSMKPALAGALAGMLIAVWLGRALEAMLYQVSARDPRALGISVAGVLLVALLASWLPARRAMRTDPCRALRES